MTRAACIGSLFVMALAAAPGAAFADGRVRLGSVFVSSGYDHHGYSNYGYSRHDYGRYVRPYSHWRAGRHAFRHRVHHAPRYAYRTWPRYYVFYSSPRYYGHQRGFPHRHGRFCGH